MKKRVVVYDAEIKNMVPNEKGDRIPNVQYCDGWTDYFGMGISVLCVWDSKYNVYRCFEDNNKHKFDRLVQKADYLVGYHSIGFDNPLIQACWRIHMPKERVYDLKDVIMRKEVGGTGKITLRELTGLSLAKVAKANGLYPKLEHGLMAPALWQQGFVSDVVNYCMHDVEMVVGLLRKMAFGQLVNPFDGTIFNGLHKSEFAEAIREE